MKNYKLAWRNLWRNRRRTLITAASVFFAVFFALFMRSLQLGSYDYMYKNIIESYSGYIQLQEGSWWDEKTLDNCFEYSSEIDNLMLADENVEATIPRIESFALASSGSNTQGVMLMGIDPVKESYLSDIGKKIVKYHLSKAAIVNMYNDALFSKKMLENARLFENSYYFDSNRLLLDLGIDPSESETYLPILKKYTYSPGTEIKPGEAGVWLGEKLAAYLELNAGDSIVLMGQGYHGTSAAGIYEIRGLIKLPVPDISRRIIYMPYDIAQEFFNAGNNITSLVLHLKDTDDKSIAKTSERLSAIAPEHTRIINWREMNEIIIQQMEADNVSGMFMISILYLVIGFGILGTVLMMTAERKREFGVLVAVGMQKKKLASIMSYELLYIGLLGILAGMVVSAPIILYGVDHPIVFKGELAHMMEEYDFEPKLAFQGIGFYFVWQAIIVGIMVLISLIHPLRKILKMNVVTALRA